MWKAAGVALGIVGLLILVAMAARGSHPSLAGHVAQRPVPNSVQDDFVTLLALVYVIALVGFAFAFFRYYGKWKEPQSRWLLNYALTVVLMLIVTGLGYLAITHGKPPDERQARLQARQAQRGNARPGVNARARQVPVRQAHFQWPLALGVFGLLVAGSALLYLRGRRELVRRVPPEPLEETLAGAIDTSIADLAAEPDARRAVIAAYAQMERALAVHGLERDAAEAPLEYLARILRGLDVREDAVRTLTRLFQYAKFSMHGVDAAMKDEAIAALAGVRDDLRRDEELAA